MQLLGVGVNAAVVAAVGFAVAWANRGRSQILERRMDRLENRMDQRMDAFQGSLDGMRESFQASLDTMRSDITSIALATEVRPRAENG